MVFRQKQKRFFAETTETDCRIAKFCNQFDLSTETQRTYTLITAN